MSCHCIGESFRSPTCPIHGGECGCIDICTNKRCPTIGKSYMPERHLPWVDLSVVTPDEPAPDWTKPEVTPELIQQCIDGGQISSLAGIVVMGHVIYTLATTIKEQQEQIAQYGLVADAEVRQIADLKEQIETLERRLQLAQTLTPRSNAALEKLLGPSTAAESADNNIIKLPKKSRLYRCPCGSDNMQLIRLAGDDETSAVVVVCKECSREAYPIEDWTEAGL